MCPKSLQSCLALCNVMDCSLPGSSVLCLRFSRQEYKSGLSLPIPGDLPDLGTELGSLALQACSLPWVRKTPGEENANPLRILAWEILCREEPGGLQSMRSQRVGQH